LFFCRFWGLIGGECNCCINWTLPVFTEYLLTPRKSHPWKFDSPVLDKEFPVGSFHANKINKILPLVFCHVSPVHMFGYYLFNMCFNIILLYMPRSSKKSPPLRFFHQNLYSFFSCPICATCHYPFCCLIWSLEWYLVRSTVLEATKVNSEQGYPSTWECTLMWYKLSTDYLMSYFMIFYTLAYIFGALWH